MLTVVDVQEKHSALFNYIKSVLSMLTSFLAKGLTGHSIQFLLQNKMLFLIAILADLSHLLHISGITIKTLMEWLMIKKNLHNSTQMKCYPVLYSYRLYYSIKTWSYLFSLPL